MGLHLDATRDGGAEAGAVRGLLQGRSRAALEAADAGSHQPPRVPEQFTLCRHNVIRTPHGIEAETTYSRSPTALPARRWHRPAQRSPRVRPADPTRSPSGRPGRSGVHRRPVVSWDLQLISRTGRYREREGSGRLAPDSGRPRRSSGGGGADDDDDG